MDGCCAQECGQLGAEGIHAGLQAMVEQAAHHCHATLRPLTHPAELRMVELRHGAVTHHQRTKQG